MLYELFISFLGGVEESAGPEGAERSRQKGAQARPPSREEGTGRGGPQEGSVGEVGGRQCRGASSKGGSRSRRGLARRSGAAAAAGAERESRPVAGEVEKQCCVQGMT